MPKDVLFSYKCWFSSVIGTPVAVRVYKTPSILLYIPLERREYLGLAEAAYSLTDAFTLQRGGIHSDTFGCVML